MIIGFSTSCMNRRWQLDETLASNLEALADTPHFIALCDYNSADDVGHLVKGLSDFVRRGKLVYFRTTEPRTFHMSIAKNTAHRLALHRGADVLFNLDADNHVTKQTVALVEEVFGRDRDSCLHNWDCDAVSGTCGRVALAAPRWQELGGYDEQLLPIAWQDVDLLYRARAIGLHYQRREEGLLPPVPNSAADKLAHIQMPEEISITRGYETFGKFVRQNIVTSLARPVRLPFGEQRRFAGQLNFDEDVVI